MTECHHIGSTRSEAGKITEMGPKCPSRQVMEILADKWKLLIIHLLSTGVYRNNELLRVLEGVSQKMLTQSLRALERDGLVQRMDFREVPPRVEYTLTPLGKSLQSAILSLSRWGTENFDQVIAARETYDFEQENASTLATMK